MHISQWEWKLHFKNVLIRSQIVSRFVGWVQSKPNRFFYFSAVTLHCLKSHVNEKYQIFRKCFVFVLPLHYILHNNIWAIEITLKVVSLHLWNERNLSGTYHIAEIVNHRPANKVSFDEKFCIGYLFVFKNINNQIYPWYHETEQTWFLTHVSNYKARNKMGYMYIESKG